MFFTKKLLVCYCSSTSIKIYHSHDKSHKLTLPEDLVLYSEILDTSRLEQLLKEFIASVQVQNTSADIVLSPELVFVQPLSTKVEDNSSEIETIVSQVPIERSAISVITVEEDKKSKLYIINKSVPELLSAVLSEQHIKITSIVPVIAFTHLSKNNRLSISSLRKGLRSKKQIRKYNFLNNKNTVPGIAETAAGEPEHKEHKEHTFGKQWYLLLASLLALLVAVVYLVINYWDL